MLDCCPIYFLLSTPGMTAEPVSVGLRKQLLVDDWVEAEKSGVTRELGRVEKQKRREAGLRGVLLRHGAA